MAGSVRVWSATWKWCSLLLLLLLLVLVVCPSYSFASTNDQKSSPNTLARLVSRLIQSLPSLKQALIAPQPSFYQERSSDHAVKGHETNGLSDYGQTKALGHQCFDGLGCLSTGHDFYHSKYRPFNLVAEPREVVAVNYTLYTREALQGFQVQAHDVTGFLSSSFRADRPTKFVIHGYLNGRRMPWLEKVVKGLLEVGDFNVVYVDWTGGSLGLYSQAVANARLAGLEIAHLLTFLKTRTQLQLKDVHLIGHSLGSHLAGYAGEQVPGLGRITGLDPAEPFFQFMPPSVRLDPTDALLVDVIHTDAGAFNFGGGYGLEEAIGHLDFYPNGGVTQPGCEPPISAPLRWLHKPHKFETVWDAVEDALGCNHIRAVELFLDSMRSQCPYVAFKCSSLSSFKKGECFSCGADGSGCVALGLYADTWRTAPPTSGHRLYLVTGPQDDLCVYHYRARLEVGNAGEVADMGFLNLEVLTPDGHTASFDLTSGSARRFKPGYAYTFLLQHSRDLGTARTAHLTWSCPPDHQACQSGPTLTNITLLNIEQFIQRRRGRQLGQGASEITFCATEEAAVREGMTSVMSACLTT